MQTLRSAILAGISTLLLAQCASTAEQPAGRWWKGNLHTHSLWTDGKDFPEMIAAWYRDHGYNFLAITEHDMLQAGDDRWVDMLAPDPGWPPRNASARSAFAGYLQRFGGEWVEQRKTDTQHLVRLRPLSEYRDRFEQPDSFLFIMSEEITDRGGAHVNAFNLATAIKPRGGETTAQRTTNNLAAVAEQRAATGRMISAVINHPNYVWSLKPAEIAAMENARLFEVYNGHKLTNSAGDSIHASTDELWDIVLATRHRAGMSPVYGVATDDAHDYRPDHETVSMPGRGWVMVRAQRLRAEDLLSALEAGDFYASTGVTLERLQRDASGISLNLAAEPGVSYRIQFIGTRVNGEPGEILSEVTGTNAQYRFKGDELYVRAKIISTKPQIDPISGDTLGVQTAWVQPVMR